MSPQSTRRSEGLRQAGADYEPIRELGGLLAEDNLQPLYGERGELVGLELTETEPGGVFESAGLSNHDIVTSVNGLAWADLVADLVIKEQLEIAVERIDGTEEALSPSTEELLRAGTERLESGTGNRPLGDGVSIQSREVGDSLPTPFRRPASTSRNSRSSLASFVHANPHRGRGAGRGCPRILARAQRRRSRADRART